MPKKIDAYLVAADGSEQRLDGASVVFDLGGDRRIQVALETYGDAEAIWFLTQAQADRPPEKQDRFNRFVIHLSGCNSFGLEVRQEVASQRPSMWWARIRRRLTLGALGRTVSSATRFANGGAREIDAYLVARDGSEKRLQGAAIVFDLGDDRRVRVELACHHANTLSFLTLAQNGRPIESRDRYNRFVVHMGCCNSFRLEVRQEAIQPSPAGEQITTV